MLAARIAFDPQEPTADILDDLWTKFYGAAGDLRSLETDYAAWRSGVTDMRRRYQTPGLDHVQGRSGNPLWGDRFAGLGYKDGSAMEHGHTRLGKPLLEWKWRHNPGPEADSLPWTRPDHDDEDRPTTHVVRDTWSSLGHRFGLTDEPSGRSGRMAYRANRKLPPCRPARRLFSGAAARTNAVDHDRISPHYTAGRAQERGGR